jgi:hypothetical protein
MDGFVGVYILLLVFKLNILIHLDLIVFINFLYTVLNNSSVVGPITTIGFTDHSVENAGYQVSHLLN